MPTIKRKDRPPSEWVKRIQLPIVMWGGSLFGPRDESEDIDGSVVGGLLIRTASDGSLVGIVQPTVAKETQ